MGVNLGGNIANRDNVTLGASPLFVDATPGLVAIGPASAAAIGATGLFRPSRVDGVIGGGQIGYNWQFGSPFLLGLEADFQGVGSTNTGTQNITSVPITAGGFIPGFAVSQGVSVRTRLDYFGTVRGRVGYSVTPTFLLYATGGLAYAGVRSTTVIGGSPVPSPLPFGTESGFGSTSRNRVGYTVGAGVEYMFAPNWSAKAEYLYYDLGRVSYAAATSTPAAAAAGGIAFVNSVGISQRVTGHIARVGVNYHLNWFGGSAPVVARY